MKRKIHIPTLISALFFLVIIFNVYTVTKLPIRELAFTTMEWTYYIAFFMIGYALHRQSLGNQSIKPFYNGFILFTLMYVVIHILNRNFYENDGLTTILLVLVFLLAIVYTRWTNEQIHLFGQISILVILLIYIHWLVTGMPTSGFHGYIRNPNILGVFIASLLFFPLVAFSYVNKWNRVYIIIGIIAACVLIYVSSARAVLLSLATVFISRLILKYSRKLFSYLFIGIVSFNIIFLFIYGLLARSSYMQKLDTLSVEIFGKRFFSGREYLWEQALQFGLTEPLLGHKIGILPKEYIDGTHLVHAHNQYLQIFLESGFIGLLCFVIFLFCIWKMYQKRLDSNIVQWAACFFLGILVYQNTEISLFFNMEPIGLIHWLIIGLGLSAVSYTPAN